MIKKLLKTTRSTLKKAPPTKKSVKKTPKIALKSVSTKNPLKKLQKKLLRKRFSLVLPATEYLKTIGIEINILMQFTQKKKSLSVMNAKDFTTIIGLEQHQNSVHSENPFFHYCKFCNKSAKDICSMMIKLSD